MFTFPVKLEFLSPSSATHGKQLLTSKSFDCIQIKSALIVKCVKESPKEPGIPINELPYCVQKALTDYDRNLASTFY